MQTLQLYIKDQLGIEKRVDLFQDEQVTITDSIVNVKDISKVFTSFTQSFTLPASATNNKLFSHYYNFDIIDGFDGRLRTEAKIEINTLPFKKGKIQLEGVQLKHNKPFAYKVTFFGDAITINDILGDTQLSQLDYADKASGLVSTTSTGKLIDANAAFLTSVSAGDRVQNKTASTFTMVESVDSNTQLTLKSNIFVGGQDYVISLSPFYDNDSVFKKMQLSTINTEVNSVIVPLITHTQRYTFMSGNNHYPGNLKFHTGSQNDHGVKYTDLKYALRVDSIVKAITATFPALDFTSDFFTFSNKPYSGLFMWLHRKAGDVSTLQQVQTFNATTQWTGVSGADVFALRQGTNLRILNDFDSGQFQSTSGFIFVPDDLNRTYSLTMFKDNQVIFSNSEVTGNTTVPSSAMQDSSGNFAGVYYATVAVTTVLNFTCSITLNGTFQGNNVSGQYTGVVNVVTNVVFNIDEQIPEMTVLNFLTGLFKMFNLVTFVQDDGKIYVDTLDSFNANKTSTDSPYDISKYIDTSKNTVDVAIPYRQINFNFEGLGSFLTKQYTQLNNDNWGGLRFTNPNVDVGGVYEVKAPFEHVLYERLVDLFTGNQTNITVGYMVNEQQEKYIGKPLLFYPLKNSNQGGISFLNNLTTAVEMNQYLIPLNSPQRNPSTSRANINFGLMTNEYTGTTDFTNTLFEVYYKDYIENVFKKSARIIKVEAYLPQSIIMNYTLADKLIINNRNYRINSLTINLNTRKSSIELTTLSISYAGIAVIFQGSAGFLFYKSSIGSPVSLAIGDVMFTTKELTNFPTAGDYFQTGSNTPDTHCNGSGFVMRMVIGSNGVITSITCGQP